MLAACSSLASASELTDALQKREHSTASLTFKYRVERSVNRLARTLPSQLDSKHIDELNYNDTENFVIKKASGLTVVTGDLRAPSIDNGKMQRQHLTIFYGDQFQGIVSHTTNDAPLLSLLSRTSGRGERWDTAPSSNTLFTATSLVFLTGSSPVGLFGFPSHEETSPPSIVFSNYKGGPPDFGNPAHFTVPRTWRFTFDKKTNALSGEETSTFQPDDHGNWSPITTERIVVSKYKTYEGVQYPAVVTYERIRINGSTANTAKYTLTDIGPTEDGLELPIPKKLLVNDFRLDVVDSNPWDFPNGAKPVSYFWSGHLPSLDELRGMREPKKRSGGFSIGAVFLVVAILAGGLLVWQNVRGRKQPNVQTE